MSRKTNEKLFVLLIILMIIAILSVDFFLLGSNLISYATDLIEKITDEPNIKFSAYFKNENNEKVNNISQSIKSQDLKLYAEIQVQKEGYLKDGIIEVQNTNFNVKNDILSPEILKIEGNKIKLKQINAGETVEIEIGIEPIITNKVPANMEFGETVKLTGKYVSSENEEGEEITPVNRTVSVNYKPEEPAMPELEKEVITKKVYTVNDTTETMVQLLVKSRLSENQYPVKETKIEVSVPEINGKTPKVKVIAANGRTEIKDYIVKDGVVKITLSNEPDAQNQVKWYRNGYDEIIVTYIYEGTVDASNAGLTVSAEIELYNAENEIKPKAGNVSKIIYHEKDNRIIANQEINTVEMYKGPLYANTEMTYTTTTTLVVPDINEEKEVVIKEGLDKFILEDRKTLDTDSKYVKTEIDKKQLIDILGSEGTITIKSGNTTLLETTKVSEVNEEKITVNYTNPERELEIITSTPKAEGIVEIQHTKTMTSNGYTRDQIRAIKEIAAIGTIQGKTSETEPITAKVEIKETRSKADLIIVSEGNLSTTEETNLKLGITLVANGAEYDLYKNPVIAIQMPTSVENVTFNTAPIVQNVNEKDTMIIEEKDFRYDETTKQIKIKVTGEQTTYPEGSLSELYIPLDLNVKTSRLAASEESSIKMMYTNENATQYYGETIEVGVVEQEIKIQAPSGLIKYFNISSNDNKTLTEDITENIYKENAGKQFEFEIAIVNNTESDITDVKILGKLPTTGNDENTMETTLKSLTAPNATTYFTENSNATNDIEDATNGWTTNLSSLTNAKLYLIKLDSLVKGSNYIANAKIKLPNQIGNGTISNTQYEVTYTGQNGTKSETSRKILLKALGELQVELVAQLGQENLKTGDIVKEGEVVKYTAIIRNNSNENYQNIQLKANVPEGTVVVEPVKDYVYVSNPFYYEEKTDIKEISMEIPALASGKTYTTEYEVRVNMDATTKATEISNKAIAIYGGKQIQSEEIKNTLENSDIRVTIRPADDENAPIIAGGYAGYTIYIQNLSDKKIENMEMQIVSNEYSILKITDKSDLEEQQIYDNNKIAISEIQANGNMLLGIYGEISKDITNMNIHAVLKYAEKEYKTNTITKEFTKTDVEVHLTSPQNNKRIKPGETVIYNITVKNIGDNVSGKIMINNRISEYLEIKSIYENDKPYRQTTDPENEETYMEIIPNDIVYYKTTETKADEIVEITIETQVKEILIEEDGMTISNKAELNINETYKWSTEEVTHILDCGQKNIIRGSAWFDEDLDGERDSDEPSHAGINVKVYNISTKRYLKNENGEELTVETNNNGEYELTKIPNGSYIIVFEHSENYEPTEYKVSDIESSKNSKAKLENIFVDGKTLTVSGIRMNNIQDIIIINANLGLREKQETLPENPENPGNPEDTDNPYNPDNPEDPDNPYNPDKLKEISGYAWLDLDRDGEMDQKENLLEGIKVKLYNISTQDYLKDEKGKAIQSETDKSGKYRFTNIKEGSYIVIFEYNTEEYELTTYLVGGADATQNSKAVLKKLNINGEEITIAVTDTINVKENASNINIGLREKLVFDLELSKSITKIVVQNNNGTKTYNYENETFTKVEIHRKQINGSLVVLEYTIKVKNTGEVAGYAKNIVDYLPKGLQFSSELNKDWYLSENYLYTKALENVEIMPGEEKEVKLILTKTMTNDNIGLVNNRAEICQDYNEYGIADIDSKINNQVQDEDDLNAADVIIAVSTGGSITAYILLVIINSILIGIAIYIMNQKTILYKVTKGERREKNEK